MKFFQFLIIELLGKLHPNQVTFSSNNILRVIAEHIQMV